MRYEVLVDADFSGVKNIFIEQSYSVKVSCAGCGLERDTYMKVDGDGIQPTPQREGQKENLAVSCRECGNSMKVSISRPQKAWKFAYIADRVLLNSCEEIWLSEKRDNSFVISEIESKRCFILDVSDVSLCVLTDKHKLFRDVEVVDGSCVQNDGNALIFTINNLKINLLRIK